MCGIAGIIGLKGEDIRREEIEPMTAAIAHRGPDGSGMFLRGPIGLGHRRLSIIDVSNGGAQPMTTEGERHAITFNGEMYNYRTERERLEATGVRFRSKSDTEVLLQLFAESGADCVPRVRGMFAFAAVDVERKEALLVRDRLGKKPLYYFQNERRLAFASEMKALRALPDCPREIDAEALGYFLSLGYLPAPFTGIRGIHKLPAAHMMRINWNDGTTRIERYWSLPTEPFVTLRGNELANLVREKLDEAVRLRMVSDVPLGAFLSGGLDSSSVVASMRPHAADIRTFSIGFKGVRSEIPDATRVAEHLGVQMHAEELEPDVLGTLPEIVRAFDEPFGDPSCIPTYFLCQSARKHVTVALSGDGGDESFGGYARYPILQISETASRFPRALRRGLQHAARLAHALRDDTFTYRSLVFARSLETPAPLRMLDYMGNCTDEERRALCRDDRLRSADHRTLLMQRTSPAPQHRDDLLNAAMRMDLLTYLADDLMPKVDLAAMAHGLEVRCPFLDHELMEIACRIPSHEKVRGFQTKIVLKNAMRDMLPPGTLRKRKQGFRLPFDAWFRGEERERVRAELLDGPPLLWNFLDRDGVETFWNRYMDSHTDYSPQVFLLLWLRHWMDTVA